MQRLVRDFRILEVEYISCYVLHSILMFIIIYIISFLHSYKLRKFDNTCNNSCTEEANYNEVQ